MLAISPLQPHTKDGRGDQEEILDFTSFSVLEFPDFPTPAGCIFDTIDFDDLIHGVDVLPDLDLSPPEFMPEFSVSAGDLDEDSDAGIQVVPDFHENANGRDDGNENKKASPQLAAKEREKRKKLPSSQPNKNHDNKNNNCEGKRKTKVDWTPDLHRRFVQAVEQLGVDKAVPSRILELMGNHSLTRHNVASHLQKYRSHRKHLLAREAEAASWSQKRQMYDIAVPLAGGGGGGGKSRLNQPWQPGTMGFPPTIPPPPIQHHHPFRPLHVWGHPTRHVEHHSLMPVWPKQLVASHSPPLHPPPTWAVPPPVDPSFWHSHHQHAPNAVTPTPSCFPPTLPITRFAGGPPLAGIPPSHAAMYKSTPNHPPMGLHPTKESIDEAIGDVLTKPWLPLPIGLKPPSMDSVMVELQRQGVPNIPPPPSSSSS